MNFACVYRVETRGLAAVKALGIPSKQAGPQPDLILGIRPALLRFAAGALANQRA